MNRVWLNVQGKLFLTTRETLSDNARDGMLAMLLRHPGEPHTDGHPIWFVNRDASMFRWILLALNTGQLVDHNVVGVPKEIWDAEVDYYGLFDSPIVPEARKRERPTEVDKQLAESVKKHCERLDEEKVKAIKAREEVYRVLLDYLLRTINAEGRTAWTFVTPNRDKGDWYPRDYPQSLQYMDLEMLWKHQGEFTTFVNNLGFNVELSGFRERSISKSYGYEPAARTSLKCGHMELTMIMSKREEV